MIDRRAIRHAVEAATIAELPELIGALAEAQAIAQRRLLVPDAPPTASDAVELVDAAELGRRLSLPETWIRDAARQGRIPSLRIGHYRRFRLADVVEALRPQDRVS